MSETEPKENPLVNNKKFRQMYLTMVESRILDDHLVRSQRRNKTRRKIGSTRGQEACRVSTAIELVSGDLVSDSQIGVAMDHILGSETSVVLARLSDLISQKKTTAATATKQLPWIEDADDRLQLAAGAALAFRSLSQTNLVVAYVPRRKANGGRWRRLLKLSAQLELPIIFVVLPDESAEKKADSIGRVSAKARSYGIPGIPVDSNDAVALYRVAQESIGRIRSGGGAVLIDCVIYPLNGKIPDPIDQMKNFLVEKKVCPLAWLNRAGDSFCKKISNTRKQIK